MALIKEKKLIYTISDLNKSSLECIELLYNSILQKNKKEDFDFFVVTNNLDYQNFISNKWNVIYDELNSLYVGWLKFTDKLPKNYNFYIYLDSDILFYESLDIFEEDCDIYIVNENAKMIEPWFNYVLATEEEKLKFNEIQAINAGSFAFKNIEFISKVRDKFINYDYNKYSLMNQAMFEQSCFNYTIFKIKNDVKIKDFNKFIKLHANLELTEHTIYHFCGFEGHMNNKSLKMKIFHEKFSKNKILN